MKQVILIRKDLKLSKGKMSAQVAHASLDAAMKSDKDKISEWRMHGAKKVVLNVNNEEDLFKYKQLAEQASLKTALITDAGHTEIPAGTKTCLAIGPDQEEKIDKISGKLKMA
ncbi:MAG: peptidyl-tRNA hydrolase [bacterium]|nr:peptidyl-tRNA hydrolase [bacterium]